MQLKSKLMAAFILMLALTGMTALMGWKSMSSMYFQTTMSDYISSGLTEMLLSQCRQLQYIMTKNTESATETKKSIDIGLQELTKARQLAVETERMRQLDEGIAFFKWYKDKFDQMVSQTTSLGVSDTELIAITREIVGNIATLRTNIETDIRKEFTPDRFNAFIEISAANEMYANTRAAYRAFLSAPTSANAQATLDCLKLTADRLTAANKLLIKKNNIDLTAKVLRLLDDSTRGFLKTREASQSNMTLTEDIRERLLQNITEMLDLSQSATEQIVEAKASGSFQMTGVAILSLLVGLGIAFFISNGVQRQLGKDPGELVLIAQRVTEGDYDIADGSKPIGVYGNILRMVASLRELLENAKKESERAHGESLKAREAMLTAEEAERQAEAKSATILATADKLENVVNIISTASSQLSAQITQSERGASEQANRVTETAAAMDEMNSTVLEVARNASAASSVSSSTRERAASGADIVQRAVKSIQLVQQQSLQLKEDMTKLDESAKSITQIMGVISDIADQTNLLALNAAIEAARAGEAGRGFAVVADEVRKLAEKTMASTSDVANAIGAIQSSASHNMSQVDFTVKTIEEATELANQSGAMLKEIVSMADSTADQVHSIATASEEQSATSEEINQSMGLVNTIAGQTVRVMGEAAQAVSDLAAQAHILTDLIDDMKRV